MVDKSEYKMNVVAPLLEIKKDIIKDSFIQNMIEDGFTLVTDHNDDVPLKFETKSKKS